MWRTPALRCLTNARGSIHESSWHGEPQFRIQLGNLCPKINGFRVSRTSFFLGPIPKILLQTTPSAKGLCLLKTGLLACNRRFTWVFFEAGPVYVASWHQIQEAWCGIRSISDTIPPVDGSIFINSYTQQTSRYFKGL